MRQGLTALREKKYPVAVYLQKNGLVIFFQKMIFLNMIRSGKNGM